MPDTSTTIEKVVDEQQQEQQEQQENVNNSPSNDDDDIMYFRNKSDDEEEDVDDLNSRIACTVDLSGKAGKHGKNGSDGQPGKYGYSGYFYEHAATTSSTISIGQNGVNGEKGGRGGNGTDGHDGENGENGFHGTSCTITLSGSPDLLRVEICTNNTRDDLQVSRAEIFNLNSKINDSGVGVGGGGGLLQPKKKMNNILNHNVNKKNKLLICGRGGNGGNGGNGGKGGDGGRGGEGGKGGDGTDGDEHIEPGKGGNGGNGGDSGDSGNGGNAGRPGNGGNGANLVINTTDPRLLSLIEVDVSGGKCGMCGNAGMPGIVFGPGKGGLGGKGGKVVTSSADNDRAENGKNGRMGKNGKIGSYGAAIVENKGMDGVEGTVIFNILDKHGEVIETASTMYDLKIMSFTIRPLKPDGVIEPGDKLLIENIKVSNDGGLVVPSGARLLPLTTQFIYCEEEIHLPEILPFQTYTIQERSIEVTVRRNIANHSYNNVHYSHVNWSREQNVSLALQIDILDRVFRRSCVAANIKVEYSVCIDSVLCTSQIGCGDTCTMQIHLLNKSRCFPSRNNNNNNILLKITSSAPIQFQKSHSENNQYECPVPIHSGENVVSVQFTMGFDVNLYEDYPLHVFVFYQVNDEEVLIDQHYQTIQAVPHFNVDKIEETDGVMIVGTNSMTKYGYKTYNSIFQQLSLKMQWWDSRLYGGISTDKRMKKCAWVDKYRGKLIVVAVNDLDELMSNMKSEHVSSHFDQSLHATITSGDDTSNLEASGFLIVINDENNKKKKKRMDQQQQESESEQQQQQQQQEEELEMREKIIQYLINMKESTVNKERDLDSIQEFSESYRFSNPTLEHAEAKCKQIEQQFEQLYPSFRYRVKINELNIQQITDRVLASWYKMNWKYSFGNASIYRTPISILQHFMVVRVDDHSLNSKRKNQNVPMIMDYDYSKFINTNTHYFRILYSVVSSLSLRRRLEMIRENSEKMNICHHNMDEMDEDVNNGNGGIGVGNGNGGNDDEHRLMNYLIIDTIFQDLKRELKLQDQWFFRTEKLCSIIQSDLNHSLISNRDVVHAVIFVLTRLENMSYWRSWVPSSLESYIVSLKEKREMLHILKTNCLSFLQSTIPPLQIQEHEHDSNNRSLEWNFTYEQVLQEAQREAEQRYTDCTADMDDSFHGIFKPRFILKYLLD